MVRLSVSFFVGLSFVSTALTIANAFLYKKQFYPSVIYLTKSNPSMAVLYFQAAVLSYLIFLLLRFIFFGQLRVAEVEHAQERIWHAILETCLAFTIFRDDFSPKFVVQFVVLLFVKAFHWLAEDRVDYMERSPVITVLYHVRIMGILSFVSAIDSYFISYAFFTTLLRGATAQVVFGFEYAILLVAVVHIAIKYILHIHDLRSATPWENKAVYMLYAELFVNFMRTMLYMVFAIVMFKIHTLPLFVIRPFYMTIRSLQKAINDVVLSRRAINAMNNLFPLATAQELADGDNTCIICREEMTVESGAKKLPCNHIFHPNCLRSWFQRQQTCPTCRTDVLAHRMSDAARAAFGGGAAIGAQINLGAQPNFLNPMNFAGFGGFVPPAPNRQPLVAGGAAAPQQPQPGAPDVGAGPAHPAMNPMFAAGGFVPMNNMFPFGFPPPPLPPFFGMPPPPPFMGFPPAAGQPAPPAQQGIQQQPTADAPVGEPSTSTGGAGASAEAAGPSTSAGSSQQQAQPSFMPSFVSPPIFSFPQPPTFSGFSDAEIIEMEGRERAAVEARVQALRNISILLDAALLQFQQYLSVISITNSFSTLPSAGNDLSAAGAAASANTSTSGATAVNNSSVETPASSSSTEPKSNASTPTGGSTSAGNGGVNLPSSSASASTNEPIHEEVRRRRLEYFNGSTA